jgi:hypothetical protein
VRKLDSTAPARRAISPEMAARLTTIATAKAPPPKAVNESASTDAVADESVVMLDPFFVDEEKLPEFPERRMLTPQGHLDRHYKREPGLKLGKLSLGNDIVARERNAIELAYERAAELKDLLGVSSAAQEAPSKEVRRKVDETRSRATEDPRSSGGPFRERR